jgi:hypothetical protein
MAFAEDETVMVFNDFLTDSEPDTSAAVFGSRM